MYNYNDTYMTDMMKGIKIVDEKIALGWISEYKKNPTPELKDKIFKQYMKSIYKIAYRFSQSYRSPVYTITDLFQEGYLGFESALDHFDLNQDVNFLSYACFWIERGIRTFVAMNYLSYYLPIHLALKLRQIMAYKANREDKNQLVTVEEIVKEFGLSPKQASILYYLTNTHPMYLDAPVATINNETITIADNLLKYDIDYSDLLAKAERSQILEELINKEIESERNIDILRMRYGMEPYERTHSLAQIADKYGLSRERIRQITNDSLVKLRNNLDKNKEDYCY